MIEEFDHIITNRVGRPLHVTLTHAAESLGIVVLIHGFKGFRNWGFFPAAAQHMAMNGFTAVRVDLSMNGMEGGSGLVTRLDDFGRSTVSRDVDDVHDVLFWLQHDAFPTTVDARPRTIHLVGHSRGGGVAQIVGRELMDGEWQGKVIAWNTVCTWERWTPRQREHWLDQGYIDIENSRTGQKLKVFSDSVYDIEQNAERLSLAEASRTLGRRLLYLHAEADLTTPVSELYSLLEVSGTEAGTVVLEGSTHTFGMTHPQQRMTGTFVRVLDLTTNALLH